MPLPLFAEPVRWVSVTSPAYFVFWKCFREGSTGQAFTFCDPDPELLRYARDGHRIGKLFRPLPCMEGR
jgi:hypothetical protein